MTESDKFKAEALKEATDIVGSLSGLRGILPDKFIDEIKDHGKATIEQIKKLP